MHAAVAQLVEQLIRNQQVNGSSPFSGSLIRQGLRPAFLYFTAGGTANLNAPIAQMDRASAF